MTTGMTKDKAKDLTPRAGAPPAQVPTMRRSRSLSELPGSVRVPILRRTDNERMRARLEAGLQGLEELKLLREQQQKQMEEVRNTALQKKPVTSQNGRSSQSQPQLNQRRMSTTSLRLSSQSLARINEEGDDNGGGLFTNRRLQDCTNLGNSRLEHRRHSSFSLEACRNRRPLSTTDTDVFEQELSTESDVLRKTNSWSSLPASYTFRSDSTESLNERQLEPTSSLFSSALNNRKNQRSYSFSVIPGSSNNQPFGRSTYGDANNENIEPKLRRGSIQCEAVLTGSGNKKNLGIFKDVDLSNISTDSPSPLHAVLHGFKVNQNKMSERVGSKLPKSASGSMDSLTRSQSMSKPGLSCSRKLQASESNLSPRNPEERFVSHRRAFSETDSFLRLSKGVSLPNNIYDIHEGALNNYVEKRSHGYGSQFKNVRNENYSTPMNHDGRNPERYVDNKHISRNVTNRKGSVELKSAQIDSKTRNVEQGRTDDAEDRRKSEGNVFIEDGPSVSPMSQIEMRKDGDRKICQTKPMANQPSPSHLKTQTNVENEAETKHGSQSLDVSNPRKEMEYCPMTPVHEKKFSIASDEGYVASPPSTPRGRHAHSIVSDSSWISTDLDDTASSCEPSPVHLSHDLEVKVTSLQLKRSDLSQDNSKAKLSRRCSDYGITSDSGGSDYRHVDFGRRGTDDIGIERKVDGAKQELFKYDSETRPFKQTAV